MGVLDTDLNGRMAWVSLLVGFVGETGNFVLFALSYDFPFTSLIVLLSSSSLVSTPLLICPFSVPLISRPQHTLFCFSYALEN